MKSSLLLFLLFLIPLGPTEAGTPPSSNSAGESTSLAVKTSVEGNGDAAAIAQSPLHWAAHAHDRYDRLENENGAEKGIFLTTVPQNAAVFETGTHIAAQHEPRKGGGVAPPSSAAPLDAGGRGCDECPEMIPIPGHKFALAKYTVTFAEWDACVADGGCGGYQPSDNGWGRGNRPVINVSWSDAQAYIQWLSRKSGRAFRLPTAEEWEIAARAGATTNYYWGNDVGRNNANCDGCGSEWDNRKTAPVGSFKPNAFGLYDMMGNVWQWTDSCWKDNCSRRLFVGGSWNHRPEDMRATTRNWFDTSKRMRYLGFRLALTPP